MKHRRDFWSALGFLAPNLAGFGVFLAGPLVFSLVMCFTDWSLQHDAPLRWTGLANFVETLTNRDFWRYLLNTAYLMIGLPVTVAGSLALALLLSREMRGMAIYRTLFYLPSFTSGVALMLLWKMLYNPQFGAIDASLQWLIDHSHINALMTWFGFAPLEPPNWLGSPHNLAALDKEAPGFDRGQFGLGARDALVLMGVWAGVGGSNMLLYLAALTNVPQELIEAAQIDGANRWQVFRHVTWPQLAPTTFFIVIMSMIGALQGGFDQARVLTGGGPGGTTTTIAYDIYVKGFGEFRLGYASTISWILFALIFAVTLVYWRYGSRETNE